MFFYSRSNAGFSLLELMIVLTIIAILAAIAIPNYQLYVKKAKFSEVITHVAPYKTAVDICAELLGGLGNEEDNCGTAGRHEIPPIFTASGHKGSVARIETEYQSPDVLIRATTQGLGEAYTYVLRAHVGENTQVEWSVDASSTCLTAGLCHE